MNRDYPPEYDETHAIELSCPFLPEDTFAFWLEDGTIQVMFKPGSDYERLEHEFEFEWVDDGDEEANLAAAVEAVRKLYEVDENRLRELRRRIFEAEKKWRDSTPPETWEEFWDGLRTYMDDDVDFDAPDTVFIKYCDEAGDWTPWYCDDCDTYHTSAHDFEYGRDEEGRLYIEVGTVDQDGDWDYDRCYEGDWPWHWRDYINTDHHFIQWANYYEWCARNGGTDPLEQFYSRRKSTVEECIKACEDNLKYLEKSK